MKTAFIIIVSIHGLIHLIGFVKAFDLAELKDLTLLISKQAGIIWLITALFFIISLIMFLLNIDSWWIISFIAVIISQTLIFTTWKDAKFGAIANLIILIPIIISFANALPSSFNNIYKKEITKRLALHGDSSVVQEKDLKHLPNAVKKYLHFAGAVGKPKIYNFKMDFSGRMKFEKDKEWMKITSKQYNFLINPARIFLIKSTMYGIPFNGLHFFAEKGASMEIKIASLIKIVDIRGNKMNQGETVTMFNDICLMAPATLIDKNIKWKEINPLKIEAKFTNNKITITAILYFKENGELHNFSSNDRFKSLDGIKIENFKWSTPIKNYKNINGRKIPAFAEAVWHMPDGEFSYAQFHIDNIKYNVKKFE